MPREKSCYRDTKLNLARAGGDLLYNRRTWHEVEDRGSSFEVKDYQPTSVVEHSTLSTYQYHDSRILTHALTTRLCSMYIKTKSENCRSVRSESCFWIHEAFMIFLQCHAHAQRVFGSSIQSAARIFSASPRK